MTGTGTCVLDGQQLNSNITLIGYTTALCFLLQPFYLRCFVVHFWLKKSGCCCVRASKAKQILSINHMDRKVVGGKFNVLVHYVDDCLPNLYLVLSSATLPYEIFCCSFLVKNLFPPPSTTAKWIPKHTHICLVSVSWIETPTNHLCTTFVMTY